MKRKEMVFGLFPFFLGVVLIFGGIGAAQTEDEDCINLNHTTAEQLVEIPEITDSLAKAIVEFREKSGPFKEPEDLLKVPGMTEELLDELAPEIDEKGDVIICPEEEEEPILAPSKC